MFLFTLLLITFIFDNINAKEELSMDSEMNNRPYYAAYLQDGSCILRSPSTPNEWATYHTIRQMEIVNRYCPKDYVYNANDPEELMPTNYRFVFVDTALSKGQVVGVIRVDLLKDQESSIRWVAIASEHQGKRYGTKMLTLVEQFVQIHGKRLIRVPAEEASKAFYQNVGFVPMDWPDAPQNDGNVFLSKVITG